MSLGRLAAALASLLLAASCAEKRERPGPAGGHCEDARCVSLPPIGSGGSAGSEEGGLVDAGFPDGAASITLSIVLLPFEDFTTPSLFSALAEVRAEAAIGGEVSGQYDGQNPVELQGVALGPQVWFTVIPNVNPEEAMPTLAPIDTQRQSQAVLSVIPAGTLDLVYSLLAAPTTRQSDTGHVVLRFVRSDDPNVPISGVSISQSTAEIVAYDNGGSFSELDAATGPLGLAVLANLPAVPLPGSDQSVTIRGPAATSIRVRVGANAVTLGEVPLEL